MAAAPKDKRTMKLDHILLTSDLSSPSLAPFAGVMALAREIDARITLLSVVEDLQITPHGAPFAPALSSPNLAKESKHAQEVLEEQRKLIGSEQAIEVAVVCAPDVAAGIVAYADKHEVDMIGISTHGRTGFRHLALGSVAEQVIRRSHVPVLSFPRPKE
jgi:nucleotide-binding universal stress UspA family protein